MAEPVVSICTPTYNRPAYLHELLKSVVAQTYRRWEMIVCDNSESDDTAQMMRAVSDPRIRYVKNERNLGMGGNTVKALRMATGIYFTFTPDDDVWSPTNLEKKVAFLEANDDLDAVFSMANRIDRAGRPLRPFAPPPGTGAIRLPAKLVRPSVTERNDYFINILTALLRRATLHDLALLSFHLNTEEGLMWYLGCTDREIGYVHANLVSIREADHYRVARIGGQLVDFRRNRAVRQRQLIDFYRSLLIFRPEIEGVLRSQDVVRYVARAVIRSGGGVRGRLRGVALALAGIEDARWRDCLWEAIPRPLASLRAHLVPSHERSGIGGVDYSANTPGRR